jgi:N-acetylmuramoyl-L-alanine amidase CwlA
LKTALIPLGHPNRHGWKLESLGGYVVHSTANLRIGTGDEFHARWFSRQYVRDGETCYEADGKTPFRNGATHVVADADSVTLCVPLDEYVPGAGDRPRQWEPVDRGQRPLARVAFENRQNWRTIQIEICESGGWNKASEDMARDWLIEDMTVRGVRVDHEKSIRPSLVMGPPDPGRVIILRHYDLTGKHCPTKMWADDIYWNDFVRYISAAVNGGQP